MSEQEEGKGRPPASILQFIWRAYLRNALLPVLLIELALIAAYLLTNTLIKERSISAQQKLATEQLPALARQQAEQIGQQLSAVAQNTELLRQHTERAYRTPFSPDAEERARYTLSPEGALYTSRAIPGGAVLFYSNRARIGDAERSKALQLSQLDPLLKSLVETQPLVRQAYLNTRDFMSRVYPYVDILAISAPDIDATAYNFYYEADAAHDPERRVVWTEVYTDPMGQGWVASAIAPVYLGHSKELEAVVGLDITVDTIVKQVLQLHLPWHGYGVLIDKRGTILALPSQGEEDWGMAELVGSTRAGVVRQDIFKPDTFSLLKREDSHGLGQRLLSEAQGLDTVMMRSQRKHVAWSTVAGTGWKLLVVVDEEQLFEDANVLNDRVNRVGVGMLAGLLLFYLLFFAWLFRRVRGMSAQLATPLVDLEGMMQRIAQGQYTQPRPDYPVLELQRTGEGLVRMGSALGQSDHALREARSNLEQLNLQLEERIRQRTGELEDANAALHHENAARQALIHDLRRTQDQLVQSEKLASLGQLTAGIAHEIKNPLNFVNNMAEVNIELAGELEETLKERSNTRWGEVRDILENLKRNEAIVLQHGQRADRIVRSMMEHARGGTVEFLPTDVNALTEEYVQLFAQGEQSRQLEPRLTFKREFDPTMGLVHLAPQEIGRVLQNLLQNAVYAVAARRRAAGDDYAPTITVRTWKDHGDAILQVEDNGIGIPREFQTRIFDPFFTTKPPGGGNTGLGLSLSHDIVVKMHGGRLTVDSEPERYARFTVRLPALRRGGGAVG